ncbi:MAG TPA: Ni/Fe hydrogenase [Flavobacteriales bacterium]|nr:Ni/Fe hydrogenase [Flavobacteriales bacterium]
MPSTLIYGIGNPGRQDDALGILAIEELKSNTPATSGIDFEQNYQLNIEDAELISKYDLVYFIDASMEDVLDFKIESLSPDNQQIEFTMHAVSPAYILYLCHSLFGRMPEAYVVHVKGFEWNLKEGLTEKARSSLNTALIELKKLLNM